MTGDTDCLLFIFSTLIHLLSFLVLFLKSECVNRNYYCIIIVQIILKTFVS